MGLPAIPTNPSSDKLFSLYHDANERREYGLAFCVLMLKNHLDGGTIEQLADVISRVHNLDWRIFIQNCQENSQ